MYEGISDLIPLVEFAQFICWLLLRSISGRYFDIDNYISFMAGMIKEFDANNFAEVNLLGKKEFTKFHKVYKECEFYGNAEGWINIALEEV